MTNIADNVELAKQSVRTKTKALIDTAIVLGSGLSDPNIDGYNTIMTLNYTDIAGLPVATAPSHKGELRLLSNGHRTIALCAGRHHLYEGYSAQQICVMTYLLKALGAKTLITTNAAGALNPDFAPGDIMIIKDHINATHHNPLIGQNESLGERFPDMSDAYSRVLFNTATDIAKQDNIDHHHGVYVGVTGPSLETSAERRAFRSWGADAVGMSTVLEVIAANHCGMQVLGLSAITNLALGDDNQTPDTIEIVLENAAVAGKKIRAIVSKLLK